MLKVVIAGLGYFSRFHIDAWARNPGTVLVGACDPDPNRWLADDGLVQSDSLEELLKNTAADIVDIVAPPAAHAHLIQTSLKPGRLIICQKPFATSIAEGRALAKAADAAGATLIIHENFRFQPWYRALKAFLEAGRMGPVYQVHFALRPGDGRGPDAYLARQPFFQKMDRFLLKETAVHFMDLFRWLLGDVESVYAEVRRLNPAISGEDQGLMILHHASGARSVFDGNRLSDTGSSDPRKTMGLMTLEGERGTISLSTEGILQFRSFGSTEAETIPNAYPPDPDSFGGGCVAALIDHAVAAHVSGTAHENTARDYLHVAEVCEAAYRSAEEGRRIPL